MANIPPLEVRQALQSPWICTHIMASYGFGGRAPKRPRTEQEMSHSRAWYGDSADDSGMMKKRDLPENHILLFTILNPVYPITVDVLHTITQTYGNVLRIVIFKKHGVQAMVEFDKTESARAAKENLDGADIYSGCCTLKIDYAKPTRLNVKRNDSETWDYTTPTPGSDMQRQRPAPLLPEPPGAATASYRGPEFHDTWRDNGYNRSQGTGAAYRDDRYPPPPENRYGEGSGNPLPVGRGPQRGGPIGGLETKAGPRGVPEEGAVAMIYGLDVEKMNADRIFNLLCLYGNVLKVKFLKSKQGSAMVQMGDSAAVERAMFYLNGLTFFGNKMNVSFSKQAYLADVAVPYELPDGSPSFKSFVNCKNNRFVTPESAAKNRLQPPCRVLHFFNTPPSMTEEDLVKALQENGAHKPVEVRLLQNKSERSSSGHMEFGSVEEAVETLVICNHIPVPGENLTRPYTMKLCFSTPRPGQHDH